MLPHESQRDVRMEVPTTRPVLREVQHEEDCVHFLAAHCCIQARTMLEAELVQIAIVFGNPRNYALTLYASIEPSKKK